MGSKLIRKLANCSFGVGIIFVIFAIINVTEPKIFSIDGLSILAIGIGSLMLSPRYYFKAIDSERISENSGRVNYFERYKFAGFVGIGLVTIGLFIAVLLGF